MMLTGRKYGSEDGLSLGLTHYACGEGEAIDMAQELAGKIASNAAMSNYMIVNSIHHAANMASEDALYAESLAAALSQTTEDAGEGLRAFLEKRRPVFR
jgi:enoyl-CoA hydratase/carnithine racemase